ncbi:MAG TPA: hypothetical protein IAC20_00050 [Candidatus Faecisoma merdavium]|nr:hypothetical protein [Candidatus Faecisoma merdavium]
MNKEYEYSLKVKDVSEFIKYCNDNNYVKEDEYLQTRTLFKNGGPVMARITENEINGKVEKILNFKDDNLNDNTLKISRESKDLIVTSENEEFVESLLQILDLNNKKVLKRKRYVFVKEYVKFEIDEYLEPIMNVIAIEGIKEEVDKVYESLSELINIQKVD